MTHSDSHSRIGPLCRDKTAQNGPSAHAGDHRPMITDSDRGRAGSPPLPMLLCLVKGVGFGEEVGDLLGEVLGAGAGKADGGDDASVAAPQPDEPGLSAVPSSGAGGAGVDLDGHWWHGCLVASGSRGAG